MAMSEEDITARVKSLYDDALVDIAGEDCSFEIYVVTPGLEGKGLLQRQKEILALFKPELESGALHALSITAKTPKELEGGGASGLIQIQM